MIRLNEPNKVLVFVSQATEKWAEGTVFGMSQNLIDLHWDDAGESLYDWETKGLTKVGVAQCSLNFYGPVDDPEPVIEGPVWLWTP